jgi:hypothetical protein
MSAPPRQPYTDMLHRRTSRFGRTPSLQVRAVPGLWRPRRLPMLFSNSPPQTASSAPASHVSVLAVLPVVPPGGVQPASHYIRTRPRATVGLTLASSLFRNHALFLLLILFHRERAPYRAGSEGDIVLRTLFSSGCGLSFLATPSSSSLHSRTTAPTSHIPFIRHISCAFTNSTSLVRICAPLRYLARPHAVRRAVHVVAPSAVLE